MGQDGTQYKIIIDAQGNRRYEPFIPLTEEANRVSIINAASNAYFGRVNTICASMGVSPRDMDKAGHEKLKQLFKQLVLPFESTKNYFSAENVLYKHKLWGVVTGPGKFNFAPASWLTPDKNPEFWMELNPSTLPDGFYLKKVYQEILDESPAAGGRRKARKTKRKGKGRR